MIAGAATGSAAAARTTRRGTPDAADRRIRPRVLGVVPQRLRYVAVYVVFTEGAVMVWLCGLPSDHDMK